MQIFRQILMMTVLLLFLATGSLAADTGKELIKANGCLGCHKLEGKGGSLGPALDQVGGRMNESELRQKLLNPKATNPKSMMPSYQRLPEKDLEAMVVYMKSLK